MANIVIDASDAQRLAKDLLKCPHLIRQASAGALNKTLNFIGAETKRQVQKEYYVTRSIQKALTKKRATVNDLTAIAAFTDKPIPMFVFKHTVARNRFRSPVNIIIKRSNGKQTTGKNPAVFKAYGKKLMRRNSGEKNIRTAYTVSIPNMVASDEVYKVIAKKAEQELPKKMQQEIARRLKKLNEG